MANEVFIKNINAIQIRIENEVTRLRNVLALNILTAVTEITPVGNPSLWKNPNNKPPGYVGGRARGNWQVSQGQPVEGETGMIDPNGAATIKEGEDQIAFIPLGVHTIIQNNVPYIVVLDQGREDGTKHSEQAPIGFVELSVSRAQEAFEQERFNLA